MKITIPHDELEVLARASLVGRGFTPAQAAAMICRVKCNHKHRPATIALELEEPLPIQIVDNNNTVVASAL
jgi:hypothetical protein